MLRSLAEGRLFGRATGVGTPRVLALHGWARSHRDFDGVLAPGDGEPLDALAVDLPGFGLSPPPPGPWGSAEYADCVAEVLGEMATPVVVLGHSFGGRVALQLAARRPDQVSALVLTGVPLLPRPDRRRPRARYRLIRFLHRAGVIGERRMEAARQRYGSPDYRATHGVMRQVFVRSVGESYDEQLAAVRCPVTLVWGNDDTEVPLVVAEAAVERLGTADARLQVCAGAGHLTPSTVPGVLRQAVTEQLAARSR